MKRKINRVGGNTLTVSLPIQWAREQKVKAGEDVDVVIKGKSLILSKMGAVEQGEFVVDIPRKEDYLNRFIANPYMLGYNQIRVNFKDREVFDKARELTEKRLLGFEIVKQGEDYCIIKNIAKGIEEEFEVMFNRQITIMALFGKEVYDAVKTRNFDRFNEVLKYEDALNKLCIFCRRMLNTVGYKYSERTRAMYKWTSMIEMIGDFLSYIAQAVITEKSYFSEKTFDLFEKTNRLLEFYSTKLKKFDITEIKEFSEKVNDAISLGNNLLKKPCKDAYIVHNLLAIVLIARHLTEEII